MTLADDIIARIQSDGPITLADYMSECLLHPSYGYYQTHDPFGQDGDFITAPEISQMFGEVLGLALAQSWIDQGQPRRFTLAELGPGRGTLMSDALRATRAVPGFHDAADLVLVEASAALRVRQKETLPSARWIDTVQDLPDQPLYLIANEFFDALPIRQFQRSETLWREHLVGLSQTGAFTLGLGAEAHQPGLEHRLNDTAPGDVVELCPAAGPIITDIARRISTFGGAALIIDYGDWRSLGDTFQAVKGQQSADPFSDPGTADLTAHVDFEVLALASKQTGAKHTRLTPQGVFLERLGITQRAQTLANNADATTRNDIISAHRRLTHPDEMGNLFKVLGLYPAHGSPPPGLLE